MAGHSNNGSRTFLADTVVAQQTEIKQLGKETAVTAANLALLLEAHGREERRASEHRDAIRAQVDATRAEQLQLVVSVNAILSEVARLAKVSEGQAKTIGEHETERQQVKGAAALAKSISGAGWGIVGLIAGAIIAVIGFLAKHFPAAFSGGPPPTPPGHP